VGEGIRHWCAASPSQPVLSVRILILGAGATGGYFGARLAAAGVDVTFLVRKARAAALTRDGLVVSSPLGDLRQMVAVATEVGSGYDAAIVACKAYDLEGAMLAIEPAVKAGGMVLPLLNGVAHLDKLDARFGKDQILGGLCHIGVTLTATGTIEHLNRMQHFALGARRPSQEEFATALHRVLALGGFEPVLSADITQDMWEKFVLLAAYAGMTCLMRATVGAIAATDDGQRLMRQMLDECASVASREGRTPRTIFLAETTAMLTERGSSGTSSMLRDIRRTGRTEHDHVLGDMLKRGTSLQLPLLRVAHASLQAYEHMRSDGVL
jgi:2-dehydropantoate 2-reductase